MNKIAAGLLAGCLISLVSLARVTASTPNAGNIAVSPAIEQISLQSGQTSATFNTEITNNDKSPVVVQTQMNDFTALNNTGSVSFLNKNYPDNSLHGLAHWMQAEPSTIALAPHSSLAVPITIASTAGLAPGGHYGAVIFRVIPTSGSKAGQLTNNEAVSVLVFLTTFSGRTQALTLHRPALNAIFTALPNTIDLDFTNAGNTQTTPHGLVTITDSSNKEIGRGVINIDSGLVLPATDRLYQVAMKYHKKTSFPGTYHIVITYRAGNGAVHTYTKDFFYMNRPIIVLLLLAFLGAILAFFRKMSRDYRLYKSQT